MAVKPFGIYLLQKGTVTREQLLRAFDYQAEHGVTLLQFLVDQGAVTKEQMLALGIESKGGTFPDLGGLRGALSVRTLFQTTKDFSQLLLQQELLTVEQLSDLLDRFNASVVTTADALVATGALDRAAIDRELAAYQKEPGPPPPPELPPGIERHGGGTHSLLLFDAAARLLYDLGLQAKPGHVDTSAVALPATDIETAITLEGGLAGRFAIRTSKDVLKELSARMIDGPAPTDDEGLADALREFVNVVAGEVCGRLSDEDIEVGISAPEHVYGAPASSASLSSTFASPSPFIVSFTPASE